MDICKYSSSNTIHAQSTATNPTFIFVFNPIALRAIYRPPLCDPVDGHLLLDGGYVNNLPGNSRLNIFCSLYVIQIIIIASDRHFHKKLTKCLIFHVIPWFMLISLCMSLTSVYSCMFTSGHTSFHLKLFAFDVGNFIFGTIGI